MATETRPLALVTGASSGIGLELAKQFAQNGYDVIIAAESDKLGPAKQEIAGFGAQVQDVQVDFSTYDGVEKLYAAVQAAGRPLEAAAINAGVGVSGDFARDTSLRDELKLVNLNVTSVVHLSKRLVADMVSRNAGKILFTASIAGTMPTPFEAVYGASKAFVRSFGQSLRNELKDTGVGVTVLMPGATETEFFERAGAMDTKLGQSEKDDPAQVAKEGFEALMAGKDHVVAGSFKNKVQAAAGYALPDPAVANMHRSQSAPGSGNK